MPLATRKSLFYLGCLFLIAAIAGCAGRQYLLVDYQVPAPSGELNGQVVHLKIDDQRESASVLAPDAAYQFPEFGGTYSLTWIMPNQERILAGEHQLVALFKTVFEKRLEELGVKTSGAADESMPVLTIALRRFNLDLQNHKWTADLSYQAVLTRTNHPAAKELIQGSAERARIIGRKGADTVISDIFSDVVNRLDFVKLFRNAELIKP